MINNPDAVWNNTRQFCTLNGPGYPISRDKLCNNQVYATDHGVSGASAFKSRVEEFYDISKSKAKPLDTGIANVYGYIVPLTIDGQQIEAAMSMGHGVLTGKCGDLFLIKHNDKYVLLYQTDVRSWSLELSEGANTYIYANNYGATGIIPEVRRVDYDTIITQLKALPDYTPSDEEEQTEEEDAISGDPCEKICPQEYKSPTTVNSDPNYVTNFEKIITAENILTMFADWSLNYNGLNGLEAAVQIKKDISDAIRLHVPALSGFCNSGDNTRDLREAAAFFANVRKETGGFASLEEQGVCSMPGTYCSSSPSSGASAELQEAGKNYECAPNKSYGGRSAIQLTWNFNYGAFSEFLYGNKNTLLLYPDCVDPYGPVGWCSSLWFWMSERGFGGTCPPKQLNGYLETGAESCHNAMSAANGSGMGKTINIINGGYECCPTSALRASPIARIQSYLDFCGILGVPIAAEDVPLTGTGCPLISETTDKSCPLQCSFEPKDLWLGADKHVINRYNCDNPLTCTISPETPVVNTDCSGSWGTCTDTCQKVL